MTEAISSSGGEFEPTPSGRQKLPPSLEERLSNIEYSVRALAYHARFGPAVIGTVSTAMYDKIYTLATEFRDSFGSADKP